MDKNMIIKTDKLSVSLGKKQILTDIDLKVPHKSIYGFLGPNGAGKTTLIRALLNLVRYKKGRIKIYGQDPQKHRIELMNQIGCLIEKPVLYPHLTGKENMRLYQKAHNLPDSNISHALEIVQMTESAPQKTGTYSLGMKQRLGIAIALLHNPELLILDEPVNGLDPNGIKEIRELIIDLNQTYGKTIFISSHLLSEVEKISTDVGIINKGKLLFQGKLSELETIRKNTIRIETSDPKALAGNLKSQKENIRHVNGNYLDIPVQSKEEIPGLLKYILQLNFPVYRVIEPNDRNLEHSFFNLINQ